MTRIALAGSVEVFRSRLCIARQDILHAICWRTSQRVVELLLEVVRQLLDLFLVEIAAGLAALRGMPLAQERSDLVAVPVSQNDQRSNEVRTALTAPRPRSMTCNAFGDV